MERRLEAGPLLQRRAFQARRYGTGRRRRGVSAQGGSGLTVCGLVLAAGRGRRFGGGKLLAHLEGRPVLAHVLATSRLAIESGLLGSVSVVVPAGDAALEEIVISQGATPVPQPDPAAGLASSLRLGLDALERAAAALVFLADQPRVGLDAIQAVLAAGAHDPDHVVRPRYAADAAGPGHPVLIPARYWPLIAGTEGDRGFGPLLGGAVPVLEVQVAGANPDMDTPDDLRALRQDGDD